MVESDIVVTRAVQAWFSGRSLIKLSVGDICLRYNSPELAKNAAARVGEAYAEDPY